MHISNLNGSVGSGKHCRNNQIDVKKVQWMLNVLGIPHIKIPENGQMEGSNAKDPTLLAIKEFQKLWEDLPANGIIEPGKLWFFRLKSLTQPIELERPAYKSLHSGGYRISRKGPFKIPRTYQLFLKLEQGDRKALIDISKSSKNNLIPNREKLVKLLEKFQSLDLWAKSGGASMIRISLCLFRHGKEINVGVSKKRSIRAPVSPITCTGVKLTPSLIGKNEKNEKLPWKWDRGNGVIVNHYPIIVNGKKLYFFIYTSNEKLVTKTEDRALSCILYVASCLGVNDDALDGKAATSGWKLSKAAHARVIFKKEKNKEKIIDYLNNSKNINNNYLIWSGGHIMLYSNGYLHESAPPEYRCTPIAQAENLDFFSRKYPLWVSGPAKLRRKG